MSKYKQLAPQLAENSVKVERDIKARSIAARLKYLVSVQKNEKKLTSTITKFLAKYFSLELGALASSKNDIAKAVIKVKKAKAITKAVAKKTAAKKTASKKVASKKVASKKVASKKVVTKKVATKKVASKKVVAKKASAKKVASKKTAPAKKVAAKKSI
jgi:ribonuclease R